VVCGLLGKLILNVEFYNIYFGLSKTYPKLYLFFLVDFVCLYFVWLSTPFHLYMFLYMFFCFQNYHIPIIINKFFRVGTNDDVLDGCLHFSICTIDS
jgi:hypothetical protein